MSDPKPRGRVRDASVLRAIHLSADECCVCGTTWPLSAHHVLPRARGGDDYEYNLVMLCGSGTTGCHGGYHEGSWDVRAAIGKALTPAHVSYVIGRLGTEAGWDFLTREYRL